ncbi:bifunctional diguanylate cyclase/phosphodiesterase [Aquabacterium sp.]|uniref:putative bifunctional diguanylate cyclase/phosphodiesterase n=1 Tax=Aquabacterium sp. TaxID=1872578 RepID=UPI001985851B|nr:bifunctional diguanylate cyclase/phosphodiesterase [Aquabacterium sp.]MBC7699193.1 EAL domain-containing protein [Aquabacterium sp.]
MPALVLSDVLTAAPPGSDDCLRAAQHLMEAGFIRWDAVQNALHVSVEARAMLGDGLHDGVTVSRLIGLIGGSDAPRIQALWREALARRHATVEAEFSVSLFGGSVRHLRGVALCEYAADGSLAHALIGLQDVSAQGAVLQALSDSEARLEEAQELAQVGCWEWDYVRQQARFSAQALRMLRRPHDWAPDMQDVLALVPEDQRDWVVGLYKDAFANKTEILRYEVRHVEEDGTRELHTVARIGYSPKGQPRRLLASVQDITELKSYRRQLHSLSFFDPLTELPNRALFVDRLSQALIDASWHQQQLGTLLLDLDRFKDINDSLGHRAGDDLLKQAAQRLRQVLREYDTIARLGGDEFAVVLPDVRHPTDLGSIASKVINAFKAPFTISAQEVFVTVSIGGALYPTDAKDANQLLQHADAALYHAKGQGRNNFQFYSSDLTAQASARLTMESELHKALERHELELHYQPKFDLASGRLVGAEALMRWNHPERGLVPPMQFIPLAEDTGLIVPMGAWALRAACVAAADWNSRSSDPLKIAVNLSARQFPGGELVQTVREALSAANCQPQWLELEITESLLLDGHDEICGVLEELSQLGITIAIDDFGTGYSALSYLTRFPVQILKIDRAFIKELPSDRGNAEQLVKAIVSLGQSLNMALVAEGVETQAQADYLSGLGCEVVQGFLFGKPVSRSSFEQWVRAS